MDALSNPAPGCSQFAPILYDHPDPYCILSASHARMERCCKDVAGSKAATIDGCYPWCSIMPQLPANSSGANTSPPPTGDTINLFYQCLIDGEDGALPEGMSCSTTMQKREDNAASSGKGGLKSKLLASLGATVMVALLYGQSPPPGDPTGFRPRQDAARPPARGALQHARKPDGRLDRFNTPSIRIGHLNKEHKKKNMSVEPRPAYTADELARLYPSPLRLQQVQVLMRHGERTPVGNRFGNVGLPEFWPYCSQASRMVSAVLDPASSTWTTLDWRRRLETFTGHDSQTPKLAAAAGPGGQVDNICELGQLTDKGRETTTALGTRLRRLYVDQLGFLPTTLSSTEHLYLRTTPMPRAMESMQQALHGLYPPGTRSETLPPVAIHTRHWGDDTLLPNTGSCKRFAAMMRAFGRRAAERWDESPEMDRINAKLRRYMPADPANPKQTLKIGVASHPALVGIMDTMATTRAHDGPATKLPKDFYDAQVTADAIRVVVDEWFAGFRESSEYRTLGIGALLADVTERMVGSAEGVLPHSSATAPLQLGISGCHDTTLAATVTGLGADGPEGSFRWPPFTSHVAVELLRDERVVGAPPSTHAAAGAGAGAASTSWLPRMLGGAQRIGRRPTYELTSAEKERLRGYYVRVRYNDEPLRIPGCRPAGKHYEDDETLCTLAAFKSIVDRITPTDWKAQCGMNLDKPTIPAKPEPAGY
ncbi:hypothetical protein PWT90_05881 [Aphanocladium album]|nr:hypothetical protein PWT90_05881 [Aphanocladium album]